MKPGFHYNYHRYYNPKTGRYLTPDPIGLAGGINPYVYVDNDPVNRVDPSGLKTRIVIGKDDKYGVRVGHVGIWVENGGDGPLIYDPSGNYKATERGAGGTFEGVEANWDDYLVYQMGQRTDVEIFTFDTTPEEEAAIAANAKEFGDPRGFKCSASVSSAVSGVGAFADIDPTRWPEAFAKQLRSVPGGQQGWRKWLPENPRK